MKKIVIIMIMFMMFPLMPKAIVTNSSYNNLKIYYFGENNSTEYKQVEKWLNELDDKKIILENIDINDNKKLNEQVRTKLKIKNKNSLIIVGSSYYTSFNNRIKKELKKSIENYEKENNYCDLVNKVKNNEDIEDCIAENKKIDNQKKIMNPYIKIVMAICIVGVVLLTIFTLKNKECK